MKVFIQPTIHSSRPAPAALDGRLNSQVRHCMFKITGHLAAKNRNLNSLRFIGGDEVPFIHWADELHAN